MAAENATGIDLTLSPITWDDATWILTSAFIIFTMQSGFGLLEAGNVSGKNEVNIMVKNVVDVVFGGLTYWMYGFGLSFGQDDGTNPFCGVGYFFVDVDSENMGIVYSTFVFQLSFATTATTIVSGAMAERTKLTAYIVFSLLNTVVYCIPAHWAWASNGFLAKLGCVDFAGSGVVHMVGGVSGLVATLYLGPRTNRFEKDAPKPPMANPANAIVGMFMLWWGWLAFNCGSTFGISRGKWKLAAKTAVTTLLSSMSGGIVAISLSYIVHNKNFDIGYMVNGILGSLVSVTASCPIIHPWESIIVGSVGALATIGCDALLNRMHVDDPVAAVAVHGASGVWGLLAVGLFTSEDPVENLTNGRNGLFHGGGFYLLGVQLLAILCESVWSGITTLGLLYLIDRSMGLRMSEEEELLGADLVEHCVTRTNNDSHLVFSAQHSDTVAKPQTISNLVPSLASWAQPHNKDHRRSSGGNGRGDEGMGHFTNGLLDLEQNDDDPFRRNEGFDSADGLRRYSNTGPAYTNNGFTANGTARSTVVDLRRGSSNSLKATDSRTSQAGLRNNGNRHLLDGGALQRLEQYHHQALPRVRIGSAVMQTTRRNSQQDELAKFAHIAQVYPA